MNSLEMAKQIAAELGEQAAPQEVLAKAAEMMRVELQQGNAVDVFGVIRLQLTPGALAGEARGSAAVSVFPLPGLIPSKPVLKPQQTLVVLAVAQIDPFSRIMQKKLMQEGRKVELVEGVEQLMELIKNQPVDAIIFENNMEMADDIRHWLKKDPKRSHISLIALYSNEEEKNKLDQLRICEDELLVEPYEAEELGEMIDSEINRIYAEQKLFRHVVSFEFPPHSVYQQVSGELVDGIARKSGLDEEGRMGLVVGFREAVDNAIRHGCSKKPNSVITVAYVLDEEKITITVTDQGPGFDSTVYLADRVSSDAVTAARARHKEGRRGGLGIMLMLKSVDKLEYNREGNVAKLTKYLQPVYC